MNADEVIALRRQAYQDELPGYRLFAAQGETSPTISAPIQKLLLDGYDDLVQSLKLLPFDPVDLAEHELKFTRGKIDFDKKMTRGFFRRAIGVAETYNAVLREPQLRQYAQEYASDPENHVSEQELGFLLARQLTSTVVGHAMDAAIEAGYLSKRYYGIVQPAATMEFAWVMRQSRQHNTAKGPDF